MTTEGDKAASWKKIGVGIPVFLAGLLPYVYLPLRAMAHPHLTWGYPVTPIIFVLASLYIAVNALISQPLNALAGLGLILLGLPFYFLGRRNKKVGTGL